jgi:hypothetical protein
MGTKGLRNPNFAEKYDIKDKDELKKLIQKDMYQENNRDTILNLFDIARTNRITLGMCRDVDVYIFRSVHIFICVYKYIDIIYRYLYI